MAGQYHTSGIHMSDVRGPHCGDWQRMRMTHAFEDMAHEVIMSQALRHEKSLSAHGFGHPSVTRGILIPLLPARLPIKVEGEWQGIRKRSILHPPKSSPS